MWDIETSVRNVGNTAVEIVSLLQTEFPNVPLWSCWRPSSVYGNDPLEVLVSRGDITGGKWGEWSWQRVPSAYPFMTIFNGGRHRHYAWTGVLKITGPQAKEFYLCSFANANGKVGQEFLTSTQDRDLLERFNRDMSLSIDESENIRIHVCYGADVRMPRHSDEKLFLPESTLTDIEKQVSSFFENPDLYRKLRIPYRRGFLFVGSPGNGKTLTMRRLVRQCCERFQISVSMWEADNLTNDSEIKSFLQDVSARGPGILLIDELDSVCNQSQVTRQALLSHLDGFRSSEGLLILGATNKPGAIDSALIERPSRFDRVWHFPLPSLEMRLSYLNWAFEHLEPSGWEQLAQKTEGWSFAYLNELRMTTAILAAGQHLESTTADSVAQAFEFLAVQFRSGQKHFAGCDPVPAVGFK